MGVPGCLAVRTRHFHHCCLGLIPALRTDILHEATAFCGPKTTTKTSKKDFGTTGPWSSGPFCGTALTLSHNKLSEWSVRRYIRSSHCGSLGEGVNIVSVRMRVQSLVSLSGLSSIAVGLRCVLDPMLLWLWRRPAAAALIWPLAWEFRMLQVQP